MNYLIARAQTYSAARADDNCNLFATSASEIREYETEIFLKPILSTL